MEHDLIFFKQTWMITTCITLFISITMLCGTDNIMKNIPHIQPHSVSAWTWKC